MIFTFRSSWRWISQFQLSARPVRTFPSDIPKKMLMRLIRWNFNCVDRVCVKSKQSPRLRYKAERKSFELNRKGVSALWWILRSFSSSCNLNSGSIDFLLGGVNCVLRSFSFVSCSCCHSRRSRYIQRHNGTTCYKWLPRVASTLCRDFRAPSAEGFALPLWMRRQICRIDSWRQQHRW